MKILPSLLFFCALVLLPTAAFADSMDGPITRYLRNKDGSVSVFYGSKKLTITPRETDPTADPYKPADTQDIALAADGKTLGWLIDYDNCCQSYPIPLALVVYRSGKIVHSFSSGLMIWTWAFFEDGAQVGFVEGPTHGDNPGNYVLYNSATGAKLTEIMGPLGADAPDWARVLEGQR